MAGILISVIGAVVGSTVAVLFAWASVGTCLGCLSGVFLVLLDGGTLLRTEGEVSMLFGALIAASVGFSWVQVGRLYKYATSLSCFLFFSGCEVGQRTEPQGLFMPVRAFFF